MPSPIGHALAGVAIAWIAEELSAPPGPPAMPGPPALPASPSVPASPALRVVPSALICAALAVLPDIDLVYLPIHRTVTHSVTAALLVFIVAMGVTRWVTGNGKASWRFAALCGIAYGSHIVLDWLGADASVPYGLQLFWPFSDRWFVSPIAIFPGTERRAPFSTRSILINLRAVAAELALCGSLVAVLWVRRTRRSRGLTSARVDRQPPSV